MKKKIACIIRYASGLALVALISLPAFVSYAEADPLNSVNYRPGCPPVLMCRDSKGEPYFLTVESLSKRGDVVSLKDKAHAVVLVMVDTSGVEHVASTGEESYDHCKLYCVSAAY